MTGFAGGIFDELYEAALPSGAEGAWIRDAIDEKRRGGTDLEDLVDEFVDVVDTPPL